MTENKVQKAELFRTVYAKHHDVVFAYILASLHYDADLAGDCMQDVAALALQKMDTVINHKNPGGFLIVTAKHFINKHKAARGKRLQSVPFDEAMAKASYTENFDALFEERVNIQKFKRDILELLSEKELALYGMFYEKKMSVLQIAGHLQTTEGNVKVRLFRLRAKVRKMVADVFLSNGLGDGRK